MFSCFICAFLRFHFFSLLSIIHVSFYFHLNVNVNIFLCCLFCVPFYPLFYLLFVRLIRTPRLFVSIVSIRNQFDPWTRCFFPISCCFFFGFVYFPIYRRCACFYAEVVVSVWNGTKRSNRW